MKRILPALIIMISVWGCAKKITPARSETPVSNTGSVSTQTMPADSKLGTETKSTTTTSTAAQTPIENTGTTGTKIAPTGTSPEASAAIAGQATYNSKCGRCHGLKATVDYTAERWASILAVMAPRANLDATEKANVYAYVKANAKL